MKRYDVYWARLDPVEGSEIGKTHPAVVVSLDVLNCTLRTVVICPITSQLRPDWRTRLPVRVAGLPGEIAADQIRTVSKGRLGKKLASLSPRNAAALRRLLGEMYADS